MDEILSSIKRIIADDDRIRPAAKRTARPATPIEADEGEQEEVLELTDAEADDSNELLLDNHKAQSLRHSFSALQTLSEPGAAPQIVRSGETSLEGMARDMLRPMLKDWLDANLPSIVEAMVDREITRITKKG